MKSIDEMVREHRAKMRGDLSAPYVSTDTLPDALYSGADGKQYTSKSALRSSYKAANNPRGIDFHEVGNDTSFTPPKEIKTSDAGIDSSIRKAISQLS